MRFLIVGCGSIGRRHLGNLKSLSAGELMAFDVDQERRKEVEENYGASAFTDFEEALSHEPDAVVICTPPSLHLPYALPALRNNRHLFIEKPLAHSAEGVDELVATASSGNGIVLVGCNFRFHRGIKLVKQLIEEGQVGKVLSARAEFGQYLPDWHPWEDYRQGYSAQKALGGGIILDSIHELDYLYWFFGAVKEVYCVADKVSNLEIDVEDMAEITLRFDNGIIAQTHLDYIQRDYNRSLKIIGQEGIITWSYKDNAVALYSGRERAWHTYIEKSDYDTNEMYVEELKHFINCIRGREKPLVDAHDGKYVLDLALAAKMSAEKRVPVSL